MSEDNRDPKIEDLKVRYLDHTKNISKLISYIGFGLLGAFYATRGEISHATNVGLAEKFHLAVGLLAVISILSDYLHNAFAARTYQTKYARVKNRSDGGKGVSDKEVGENILSGAPTAKEARLVSLTLFFFGAKQVVAAMGSFALTILILLTSPTLGWLW